MTTAGLTITPHAPVSPPRRPRSRRRLRPFGLPVGPGLASLGVAVGVSAAVSFGVAQAGLKGFLVAIAAAFLGLALLAVRERPRLLLFVLVLCLQMLFHKAIGPLVLEASAGPPGVYVSSVDVLLLALYGLWLFEGTLLADLRQALRRPVFLVPLAGSLAVLPSIFAAESLVLFLGEVTRVLFAYALFVYVALRVRDRRDLSLVLVALAAVAATQFALAVLQSRAGGTLGLEMFGAGGTESGDLAFRSVDGGEDIPRPSGTVIHAVLLGALMASICALTFNLALHLRAWWLRLFWLGVAGLGAGGVVLAMARAPAIGLAVAIPGSVLFALWRGRLSWGVLAAWLVTGAAAAAPLWDRIVSKVTSNYGTDHFWIEVEARLQLNAVALDMINHSPLIGIGLNNSVMVLERFEPYGVIFPGYPAHNLYLLVASETGIIGLAGLLVVFCALPLPALRAAALPDRYLSAVGCGLVATFVTVYVQELLVYALRHDIPRTAFWLLAGLGVATLSIAQAEQTGAGEAVADGP